MYQPNGMPPWWQAQGQGAPGQMPGQVGMGRQAPTQQPMPQMDMGPFAGRDFGPMGQAPAGQSDIDRWAASRPPRQQAGPWPTLNGERLIQPGGSAYFDGGGERMARPAVMPGSYQGGMGQSPMERYAAMNSQFYAGGGRGGMPNPYARNDYGSQMGPHPGFAGPGFGGDYQPPPMGFFGVPGQQRFGGTQSPYMGQQGLAGGMVGGNMLQRPMLQNPNWRSPTRPGDLADTGGQVPENWGRGVTTSLSPEDLRSIREAERRGPVDRSQFDDPAQLTRIFQARYGNYRG